MKKRLLSILLAMCILLTLLPTAALAASGDVTANEYSFVAATGALTIKTNEGSTMWRSDDRIGDGTGWANHSAVKSIIFEPGVTGIGDYAFKACTGLTGALVIPEGIDAINPQAFYGCTNLTSISIPASVKSINSMAFMWCTNLSSITVDAANTAYVAEGNILYNKDKTALLFGAPAGVSGAVTIPASVTDVHSYAFYNCNKLGSAAFKSAVAPTIGGDVFTCVYPIPSNPNFFITIPSGGVGYDTGSWIAYQSKIGDPSSVDGDGYAFNTTTGTLNITSNVGTTKWRTNGNIVKDLNLGSASANYTAVKAVTFESGITEIGDSAFAYCSALTSLTIPDTVTKIGESAFWDCKSLTGDLTIPAGVQIIRPRTFRGCSGLNGQLTIPAGVTAVGDYAFQGCSGLTGTLTIPDGLQTIGVSAFMDCKGLSGELTIPASVQTIKESAFQGCAGFRGQLIIPAGVTAIGASAFRGCTGFTGELTIPASVTVLEHHTFSGCTGLSALTMPSVQTIGEYAFNACKGLTGQPAMPSVITIGASAFKGCSSLTVLTMPSVITIENNAFSGCTRLIGLTMQNIQTIGASAFENCKGLTGQLAMQSVQTIGERAFYNCAGLTALSMQSVITIGARAFYDCTGLKGALTIPNVTEVGAYAFNGCNGLTGQLVIPNVKTIGDSAFYGCAGLTGQLTVPGTVIGIGDSAFYGCTGLKGLTIASGVEAIGNSSFQNCTGLTGQLTIPNTVKTIGNNAFQNCTGLTGQLTIPNTVKTIGNNAFQDCIGLTGELTIPAGVTAIGSSAFRGCTGLKGTLTMPNVKTIGEYAFENCAGLTAFTMPSVQTIGNSAFYKCTGLKGQLTIPASVTAIGASAFSDCTGFTGELTIPASVTVVSHYAFSGCTGLKGLTIAAGVKTIGEHAFDRCTGLNGELTIPASVTEIGAFAFYGCAGFSGVLTILGAAEVGNRTFEDCTGFTELAMPGVTGVGNRAFYGCAGLTALTMQSVTKIGNSAFESCKELGSVNIPASVTTIGETPFDGCAKFASITVDSGNKNFMADGNVLYSKDKTKLLFAAPAGISGALTIPTTVKDVSSYAFNGCKGLTSAVFQSKTAPTMGTRVFGETINPGFSITIPTGGVGYNTGTWTAYQHLLPKPPMTGTATIKGTLRVGERLTLDISSIVGGDRDFIQWYYSDTATNTGGTNISRGDTITLYDNYAGKYIYAVVPADGSHSGTYTTAAVGPVSKKAAPAAPAGINFYFYRFGDTNVLTGVNIYMECSLDGGKKWIPCSYNTKIDSADITAENDIKVRYTETADTQASEIATIDITKAATPSGFTTENATGSANNGKINGTTTAMEYSSDLNFATATDCGGSPVLNLAPNTYYIRIKAANTVMASDAVSVTVGVSKAMVYVPSVNSKVYNGENQKSGLADTAEYTVTESGGVNVGEYDVVLKLTNTTTSQWSDSTITDKTIKFKITKANNNAITDLALTGWAYGDTAAHTPTATAKFGQDTIAYTYAKTQFAQYTETQPTAVGDHWVKATVADTANYNMAERTLKFTISKAPAVVLPSAPEIDYAAETVATTATMECKIGTGNWRACTADMKTTAFGWNGSVAVPVSFRVKGDANHEEDTVGKTLTIPARPDTPSLTATQPSTIGGKGSIPTTTAHEYSADNGKTWTTAMGVTALAAGTYLVRVTATLSAFRSESQTITINEFTTQPEATPNIAIDYIGEKFTGFVSGGSYTVNGAAVPLDGTELAIDSRCFGTSISIVKKGNTTSTTDSAAQSLNVPKRAATPSLTATQPSTIGGKGSIPTTTAHEYSADNGKTWTTAMGVTSLSAGTYLVRVTATLSAFRSESQTITINEFAANPEATPNIAIDYANEKLTGFVSGGSYTINGNAVTISGTELAIDGTWLGTSISIVKKGNTTSTTDSAAQSLNVPKRAATPSLTATQPSTIGGKGSIPTTTAHEYSADNGKTWTTAMGTTSLAAGTYLVRVTATLSAFRSESQTITINEFAANPEATPEITIDYIGEKLTGFVSGGSYTINGNAVTLSGTELAIDGTWLGTTISIVKKGNTTSTTDSAAQSLNVPDRPAAPATNIFTVVKPSKGGSDGTLSGVTDKMEYSLDSGSSWKDGGSMITGLQDGASCLVRYKTTASSFVGSGCTILIKSKTDVTNQITFTDGSAVYNGAGQTYETATTDVEGTITYVYAAKSGSSLTDGKPQNAGSYTVTATLDTETSFGSKTVNFTIDKAASTVSTAPAAIANLTYTANPQALVTAGTSVGGTMNYSLDNTAWQSTIPVGTNAGSYTVYYKTVGDANHSDSASNGVNVTIAKKSVTAPVIASKAYSGSVLTADVATSSEYTVTANAGGIAVGNYDVMLTLQDFANCKWSGSDDAAKTLTFAITKGTWTNTSTSGAAKYGASGTVDLSALLASGGTFGSVSVTENDSYLTTPAPTMDGNSLKFAFANVADNKNKTVKVTVPVTGSTNYADYTITVTLNISDKLAQSSFAFDAAPAAKNYGDGDFIVTTTGAQGALSYVSTSPEVATIDPTTGNVTIIKTGSTTIKATSAENADYLPATVEYTLTVSPKSVIAPTADTTVFTYNGAAQTYALTAGDGYTISDNTAQTNAGTYTVTATLSNATNYKWSDNTTAAKDYTFTIGTAKLTITADNQSIVAGTAKPKYTAVTTGLVHGETIIGVTFTDSAADTNTKGSFTITPAGGTVSGGNANYNISYVNGNLTINIDVSTIDTAIADANAEKIGVIVNEYEAYAVANGTKFVKQVVLDALDSAIKTATDVKGSANTVQQVSDAVTALKGAVASFKAAIKTGTYVPSTSGGGAYNPTPITEIKAGGSTSSDNLDRLISGKKSLTVIGANGSKLLFDTDALRGINNQTSGSVTVEINDVSKDYQTTHAGKTVVKLTVTSDGKPVSDFGGNVIVSLPYTLKDGEKPEDVTVWYLAEDGTMTEIPASYDAKTGLATFTVTHFSEYVVGVDASWVNPFTDVSNGDWCYDAVKYAHQNGLFSGATATSFAPNANMTRAMLWTVLARKDGQDISGGANWYEKAQAWAIESGVSDGSNPTGDITREQLITMLWRYAGSPSSVGNLSSFTDADSVTDYAKTAMAWAVDNGLVNGSNGALMPKSNATRAQVAAIMMRLAK